MAPGYTNQSIVVTDPICNAVRRSECFAALDGIWMMAYCTQIRGHLERARSRSLCPSWTKVYQCRVFVESSLNAKVVLVLLHQVKASVWIYREQSIWIAEIFAFFTVSLALIEYILHSCSFDTRGCVRLGTTAWLGVGLDVIEKMVSRESTSSWR